MSQETQPLVGLSLWRRGVGSWSNRPRGLLGWSAIAVALLVSIPVLSVLTNIFTPASEVWLHLIDTVLASYITNTVGLVILVAAGVVSMGVISAWLVTMCRFPGRAIFEWAMILPLAVPAYVMAYAYTDFLQFSGPVQSLLRELTGWGPRDYWFPNVRSLGGAALMLMLVTYPYVYLLARTAFLEQSVCALEVSRTLGCSPWRSFYRVAVPLARPAIVGGTILALMETLADFGTVQYFGVKTFTTGIYRAWFSMGDRIAAAQLSAALLGFVFFFLMLERLNRGGRRYHHMSSKYRQLPTYPLTGWRALLAFAGCAPPVTFGFLVPAGMLLHMALIDGDAQLGARYAGLVWNSVTLAGITALLAVALAVLMNYGARLHPGAFVHLAGRIASLGYAVPGSVIAVGVLLPFAWFDNTLDSALRSTFGVSSGLLLTGTIVAVVFAYLVRFLAESMHAVEAGLTKIRPSMDDAARALGRSPWGTLRAVHAPLMWSSLLTGALMVFVDVMKELPATLIMRPFNFDTLAVQAYNLASDERLTEAATPALMIVAVGLLPVIVLSRAIARSRPGSTPSR